MRISPAVGVMSPSSIWIVVVLPAPFGPSRPRISPCRMANETPSTAVKSPKCLVRFRTWTMGSVIGQTCTELEKILFEFFADVAGETLPAQDLALVLGLSVVAPEAVGLAVGLDHRGLDGRLLRLRNFVHANVPARDHDLIALVGLRVDDSGVAGRAPFALAPLLESLHVLAMGHDQTGLLQGTGEVPLGDPRTAEPVSGAGQTDPGIHGRRQALRLP